MKYKLQSISSYKENRAKLDQFIQDNYQIHTIGMIMKAMGGSYKFIHSRFAALGLKPLNKTDMKVRFILQHPEMKSGEIAKALGVSTNHISLLKKSKISPQLKAVLR